MRLNRVALATIRERTGYSQGELARLAGVDRTLVYRLEQGTRNASPTVIRKLADGLNCPLGALIGDDEDETSAA
jgi:transcriptional regulator with XRE-family HTH domain